MTLRDGSDRRSGTPTPFNSRYPVISCTSSRKEKLLAVSCALLESGVVAELRSMLMLPSMVVHPQKELRRVSNSACPGEEGWATHRAEGEGRERGEVKVRECVR